MSERGGRYIPSADGSGEFYVHPDGTRGCYYRILSSEEAAAMGLPVVDGEKAEDQPTARPALDLGEALDAVVAAAEAEGDADTVAACRAFRATVEFAPDLAGRALGRVRDAVRAALATFDGIAAEMEADDGE